MKITRVHQGGIFQWWDGIRDKGELVWIVGVTSGMVWSVYIYASWKHELRGMREKELDGREYGWCGGRRLPKYSY